MRQGCAGSCMYNQADITDRNTRLLLPILQGYVTTVHKSETSLLFA